MHPARSLILFTSLSGLGFGLLAWLCLGRLDVSGWGAVLYFGLGFALAGGGLASSAFHLGHPERALKAFTQWRSSWLSREAWLASLSLVLVGLYAAALVLAEVRLAALGWVAALSCAVTVYATSMIYAQLKTVPRWNHWTTNAVFMGLAFGGGAAATGQVWPALLLFLVTAIVLLLGWQSGDTAYRDSGSTPGTATALGSIGAVRSFELPHTGGNYLTQEMVFVVARKHAVKLRIIGAALALLVPAALLVLPLGVVGIGLAVLCHLSGVMVLRWLFFAEAEHVVGLYYGRV